jgi:hypothetical protein
MLDFQAPLFDSSTGQIFFLKQGKRLIIFINKKEVQSLTSLLAGNRPNNRHGTRPSQT